MCLLQIFSLLGILIFSSCSKKNNYDIDISSTSYSTNPLEKIEDDHEIVIPLKDTAKNVGCYMRIEEKHNEYIKKLLESNKGIFWGDNHGDINCIQSLINVLDVLKKEGVKKLFIERDVDSYLDFFSKFNSDQLTQKNLDDFRSEYIKKENGYIKFYSGYDEMHLGLFLRAKKLGIEIIPIDIDDSKELNFLPDGSLVKGDEKKRLENSNPIWVKNIRYHTKIFLEEDKYVIFGGYAHAKTTHGNIEGVSDVLKIPTVLSMSQHPFVKNLQEQDIYATENFIFLENKNSATKVKLFKETDMLIGVPDSPFLLKNSPSQDAYLLPTKQPKHEELFEKLKKKYSDINFEYFLGKRTEKVDSDCFRYIDDMPHHYIEIDAGKDTSNTLYNVISTKKDQLHTEVKSKISSEENKEKKITTVLFKTDAAFEEFLNKLIE